MTPWPISKVLSPPSSRRETKWFPVFHRLPYNIFLARCYLACVEYTKTIIHLSVGEKVSLVNNYR